MTKKEEQCYLAGYNGKKRPPWVANYMTGMVMAYNAGKKDRKAGRALTLRLGYVFINGKIRREEDV